MAAESADIAAVARRALVLTRKTSGSRKQDGPRTGRRFDDGVVSLTRSICEPSCHNWKGPWMKGRSESLRRVG